MAVTDVGMDIEVREVQASKAKVPMAVTEVEMDTEVRYLQT